MVRKAIGSGWTITFIYRTGEAERVAAKVGADMAGENDEVTVSFATMIRFCSGHQEMAFCDTKQ